MKVLLVTLPLFQTSDPKALSAQDDGDNSLVPVGLYSLATILMQQGHVVKLCNHTMTTWEQSLQEAAAFAPDLVGITCMTHQRFVVEPWARRLKSLLGGRCRFVLGGVHATTLYADILERWPVIDHVAVGEADESFPRLITALDTGGDARGIPGIASRNDDGSIAWPGPAPAVADLGALPIPAEHFSYNTIITARGCPFSCTFCASAQMWGQKVRERPVEHVIREMELMASRHHLTQVYIKDETFTFKRARVEAMCRAIIDSGVNLWWSCDTRVDCLDEERLYWMRKAGCFLVSFGVESASPHMLEKINKRTNVEKAYEAVELARKFGIFARFYLIGGLPDESPADLMATLNLVRKARPHYVCISPLIVSPGTEMCREYQERLGTDNSMWFDDPRLYFAFDQKDAWRQSYAGRELTNLHNTGILAKDPTPHNPYTEAELKAIAERIPDAFPAVYEYGICLIKAGKYADAMPVFEQLTALRPEFGKGWIHLGECLDRAGRLDEAVAAWEQVETNPRELPANLALAFLYRGLAASAKGDHPKAVELWKRSYEAKPDDIDSLRIMGQKCPPAEDWDNLLWAAERWMKAKPEEAEPYHLLGLASIAQNAAEDAAFFLEKAIQLDPKNANYYFTYALLCLQANNANKAAGLLEACLTLSPDHPSARSILNQIRPQ